MRPSLPVVAAVSSLSGALVGAVLALVLGVVEPGGPTPATAPPPALGATPSALPTGGAAEPDADRVAPAELRQRRATVAALGVLRRWDARRARAWTRGDASSLRGLYRAGSRAGRRDVALLREYAERGWSVEAGWAQVVAARALSRSGDRVELRVLERRRGPGASAPRTRVVTLVRAGAGWQVARVEAG